MSTVPSVVRDCIARPLSLSPSLPLSRYNALLASCRWPTCLVLDSKVARLAKYQMITTEKWYTPCGSKGPVQSGPDCAVETKIEGLFRRTRAINPKQTTNLVTRPLSPTSHRLSPQTLLPPSAWTPVWSASRGHANPLAAYFPIPRRVPRARSVLEPSLIQFGTFTCSNNLHGNECSTGTQCSTLVS